MAEEHGMMEHKGKTIPREVKSLADRIRKKEPGKDDEYAYRTAWDIFRSYTAEGKRYPHKSPESGLAVEGGGTGPITKKGSVMFFEGFEKAASVASAIAATAKYKPNFVTLKKPTMPGGVKVNPAAAKIQSNIPAYFNKTRPASSEALSGMPSTPAKMPRY